MKITIEINAEDAEEIIEDLGTIQWPLLRPTALMLEDISNKLSRLVKVEKKS